MLLNMHKTKWEKWHTTSTVKMWVSQSVSQSVYRLHMGPEDPSNKKNTIKAGGSTATKMSTGWMDGWIPLRLLRLLEHLAVLKIPIIFFKDKFSLKIGKTSSQKLGPFFSLFPTKKKLSNGQKWFLRPHFPLIWGIFLLRSGLSFLFWELKVPEPSVRKRPF